LVHIWGPGDLTDRLIDFVATGTPNNGTGIFWPQWTVAAPHQLNVQNDSLITIADDTFSSTVINLLLTLNIEHPEWDYISHSDLRAHVVVICPLISLNSLAFDVLRWYSINARVPQIVSDGPMARDSVSSVEPNPCS